MDWIERLSRGPGRVALGQGTVELLHWAHQRHLPDNRPHRHTFFEACQVGRRGQGRFLAEGREYRLTPGAIFVARPGMMHQIVNTGEPLMELFWVCFQWTPSTHPLDEVQRLVQAFAESPVVSAADSHGRLSAQWQALGAIASGGVLPGSEAQLEAQITALLLTIAQACAGVEAVPLFDAEGGGVAEAVAHVAVRFVHDNLSHPLSVSEIAAQVFTSPRHLTRLFRRFTGVAPAAYIVRARMDRARGLLIHTQIPIKEIAREVGFSDVHHFTRVFSQQVGCPPGEYRRSGATRPVPNIQIAGSLV